ncbi:tail fiber [Bacillus phage vB_BanS-Thrax5]|nr:tail fiber [Bacillus phage vB_BanS-Thrax5]
MAIIGTGQMTLTDMNDVLVQATKPSNPAEGQMWWNTTESQLYVYQGGTWQQSSNLIPVGRNLIRLSGTDYDTTNYLVNQYTLTEDFVTGNDYTFVIKGTLTAGQKWGLWMNGSATNVGYVDTTLQSAKFYDGVYYVTFKAVAPTAGNEKKLSLYNFPSNTTRATVDWVALFAGKMPMHWAKAPEEVEEVIIDVTETLGNMANDNLIDYNERQVVKDKVQEIIGVTITDTGSLPDDTTLMAGTKGLYYTVRKQALQIGIATNHAKYTAVSSTYGTLRTYLNNMNPKPWNVSTANQKDNITVVKGTYRDNWLNFYNALNDLSLYTIEIAKQNVDNIDYGMTNYVSNGSFEIPLAEGLWKDNYVGDLREIVDISTEDPPFKFAYHVKATVNKNSGIFNPVLWSGKACEALVNREVTIQYWLKYQNITQGAQTYLLGRFGELVIEGEDAGGVKKYRYPRIHSDSSVTETLYISGTNMTWKKYTATIKLSLPTGATKLTKVSFKHGLEGCTGEFWTTGIKVEFGNRATDWSQSPMDLEQRIYKTEFAVRPDEIVSAVKSRQTFVTAVGDVVTKNMEVSTTKNIIDNSVFIDGTGWRNWGNATGTRTRINDATMTGMTNAVKFVTTTGGEFGYAKDSIPVIQGQTYILSAWVYLTAGAIAKVQEGNSTVGWTSTSTNAFNGWTRIIHKFTAKADNISIYVGQDTASIASTITVTMVQLEKGSIPSEWSLSPNDIQWGGGRNLLRNSNFAKYKIDNSLTWDKTLNGNIVPDGWWSNGYNGGVASPTVGYHAHINIEKFGYPVLEFIDRNSTFTGAGTHRWLGMNNNVFTTDPLFESMSVAGKTYTISMDVMADTIGAKVNVGFYHFITGNTTQNFYGYAWDLQPCVIPNMWEKKFKVFTVDNVWDLTKAFNFYLYGQTNSMECSMWIRNIKIEEGNKYTDYSQAPEDTDAVMYNLMDRVSTAEEKITDNAIINIVTQSNKYKNDLDTKANSTDLADLATKGEVDNATKGAKDYADDKIKNIDFTPYVIKSELTQQMDNLTAKFEAGGGVNLLKNSIGFAEFAFWNTTNPQYIRTTSSSSLDALGFGRAFYFPPNTSGANARLTQDVYVVAGQPYTLSWYANKTNASPSANDDGAIWVEILQGATPVRSLKLKSEETTNGLTKYTTTWTPTVGTVTIRVSVNKLADYTISGIMFNIGATALQWSLATGELYNTNIRMDLNGIKVSQLVNGVERGYTQITPSEFAGYYDTNADGQYEKVFYLKEDETVSKKFVAKEEFTLGSIKIIKVESTNNKGWAFVQVTPTT